MFMRVNARCAHHLRPPRRASGAAKSKHKDVRYRGIHEHDQLNEAQMATAVRLAGSYLKTSSGAGTS